MSPKAVRRAVIYARISITSEESVSIARQVEAAEQYAAARGWQVVGTFTDDGVSATRNRPQDREGWRALVASPAQYDAVIIWKIDRLARSTLDFLTAHESLRDRKAGIVGVEDPIDMTTAQGELFATILAAFARMEAASISARVKAARGHLLRAGRVVGGTVPYGWCSVPNPDGAGKVLAHDPDRIEYVRGMAERVLRGETIYSVVQWLDEVKALLPKASQGNRKRQGWRYRTVEDLLRNPLLAGMTAYTPGNASKVRGADVLRGPDGLPVVDESVAILSQTEWRLLVKALDERDSAQSRPRALRSKTSALLSGLVWCGECDVRMHRGTTQGRPSYYCPRCHQVASHLDRYVVDAFLKGFGEHTRFGYSEEVHEGGAAVLPEIEHRLAELGDQLRLTDDDDEAERLAEQMANLRQVRREARAKKPEVRLVNKWPTGDYAVHWRNAGDDVQEQRAILDEVLRRVTVRRGKVGRYFDLNRLSYDWLHQPWPGPWQPPVEPEL